MECHIVARSRGGPRSEALSDKEVDDYKNLILLCPTHHKLIDDQSNEYTVDALRAIKQRHEEWVDETLNWRSELPDSVWKKVKEEAEALRLEHLENAPEGFGKLLDGLAMFVVIAANALPTDELLFLIRANAEITLGFKFRKGRILVAYQAGGGFDLALSSYLDGSAIEDWSESVRPLSEATPRSQDEDEPTRLEVAASMLAEIFKQAGGMEAALYTRNAPPSDLPQLALHVEDGEILAAAGPSGIFAEAFDAFDRADVSDITKSIRATMFMNTYEHRREEGADDRIVTEFFANLFAVSVLDALDGVGAEPKDLDDEKELLAKALRDRFFESLLVFEAANERPDDPEILSWVDENMDPEPPDGFSAVLPNACVVAVREFITESANVTWDEHQLEAEALILLRVAISRCQDPEDGEAWLEKIVPGRIEWWQEPKARKEILALVEGAGKST